MKSRTQLSLHRHATFIMHVGGREGEREGKRKRDRERIVLEKEADRGQFVFVTIIIVTGERHTQTVSLTRYCIDFD